MFNPWIQKIHDKVTLGNTGAIEVFQQLFVDYPETVVFDCGVLIGMGIVGSDLFLLFQECHCNIQELHKALMEERVKEVLEKHLTAEHLARRFHNAYERLAPSFGYKTREASAVPWDQVPANNKQLMIAVCRELLEKQA